MSFTFTGDEFKAKYPGPYYKFLKSDLKHYEFTYQLGLNIDTNKFNPYYQCQKGGLYFFNNLDYFLEFYTYGPQLGIIEIPDDALVYAEEFAFKADKFILSKIITDEDELMEFFKIIKTRFFWCESVCSYAAAYGHLEVLKWARENGCRWDHYTCNYAALNGHLEVLKWARDNGCPWNESTYLFAATNGHLKILRWLKENDCPWNEEF